MKSASIIFTAFLFAICVRFGSTYAPRDSSSGPTAPHYFTPTEYTQHYLRHESTQLGSALGWICKIVNYILPICPFQVQLQQEFTNELAKMVTPESICDEHAICEDGVVTGPGTDPNCFFCMASYAMVNKYKSNIGTLLSSEELQEELCKSKETVAGKNACMVAVGVSGHILDHLDLGDFTDSEDYRRICQSVKFCR